MVKQTARDEARRAVMQEWDVWAKQNSVVSGKATGTDGLIFFGANGPTFCSSKIRAIGGRPSTAGCETDVR
jgi:hypothetical protein